MQNQKTTLFWGTLFTAVVGAAAVGWWNVRDGVGDIADVEARSAAPFRYEVSVTNMTRGQIFSPAVVATHDSSARIFTPGSAASEELAAVAEDAVLDPLVGSLRSHEGVHSVDVLFGENGPILPGETATLVIEGTPRQSHVSVVGMLVTTNDAFYALNGGAGPFHGSRMFTLNAYDAGSEANNELCSHIPGPPCNNPGVRATEDAEGYVHIHPGVHGIGDLEAAEHDWRNPVARVRVQRINR